MALFSGLPASNAAAAAELASRGVPVFPCRANKAPLTANGFKDATTDAAQVADWWLRNPAALIGMPTGAASGVDALDLDTKHGDTVEDLLAELEADHGRLSTLRVRTPSTGAHLYFRHDGRIASGASKFRRGIDWRGEGGYVIAPGTRLPDGRSYYVDVDADIQPWPETLAALIAGSQGRHRFESIRGGLADLPYQASTAELVEGTFTSGQWHEAMIRIVWNFVARGYSLDEISGMAPLFQRAGWSYAETLREVRKAAQGAFGKQQRDPRGAAQAIDPQSIKALSLSELQSRDPPDWQIGGTLSVGSFACLFGDSDTFKSFIAVSMGLSVAYGLPWMGKPVKQGPVVYVLGEGQAAFALRVQAWREYYGLADQDAPFYSILCPVAFSDPAEVGVLVQAIKATGASPGLIIVDTLARNFGLGDPDKTQDMTKFVGGCGVVQREFSSSLMVIHHSGKDTTKGARNSSVLRGAVDVEMKTERVGQAVTLENTKQKDAERFEAVPLEPIKHTGMDARTGEEFTSLVVTLASGLGLQSKRPTKFGPEETHIIEVLKHSGSLTGGEVAERVQKDADNTRARLRKLVASGLVKTDGGRRPVYWWHEQYEKG